MREINERAYMLKEVPQFDPKTGPVEGAKIDTSNPEVQRRLDRAKQNTQAEDEYDSRQKNKLSSSDNGSSKDRKKWERFKKGLAIGGSMLVAGGAVDIAEGNGLDKTVAVGREAAGATKSGYDIADRFMNYTYEERRDDYIADLGKESEEERSEHTVAGDKQSKEIDGKVDFIRYIDGSSLDEKQKNRAIVVVKASGVQIADENKVYSPRLEDMDNFLESPTEELSEDYFYNRVPKQIYDDETKKMIDLTPAEREKRAQLASEVAKSNLGTPLKSFIIVSLLDDPNFSLNNLEKPDTA